MPKNCASEPRANASNTVLKSEERDKFIGWISPILEEKFGEVIRTASNKIAVPIVLENNEEAYIVINVAIPLGEREARKNERETASSYNPYEEQANFARECEIEERKAKEKERKEKEKIEAKEKEKENRKRKREMRRKLREIEKAEIAEKNKKKEM